MAQLAIKGHPTRGREVIEILEMLGGKSNSNVYGYNDDLYYFIAKDGVIYGSDKEYEELACNYSLFTLEEFEKLYPYKVGDKVVIENYKQIFEILSVRWCTERNIIMHQTSNGWYSVNDLQPYKEEIMEEPKELIIGFTKDDNDDWILNVRKDYEIKEIEGKFKVIKKQPQYPKNYEECCRVLGYSGNYNMILTTDIDCKLFDALYRLKVCRDAYWKIAGEQMGLGKPWEPDWNNGLNKCCLKNCESRIVRCALASSNALLAFPTPEMRDVFFENFKDLINECKELL